MGRDFESIEGTKVLAIINSDGQEAQSLNEGEKGRIILDKTTFYAESGGQVGDTGILINGNCELFVTDTTYAIAPSVVIHDVKVKSGTINKSDELSAHFDVIRRNRIRRNHTATHILHWALRKVVGDHVKQAGSVVDDQRLRFDFQHFDQLSEEQLKEVEEIANQEIILAPNVTHEEMPIEEAKKMGAIAFFGDKYGERVRVLVAGPSIEFCGGTHVSNLGMIGSIRIVSEGSIGSNIRRIEALTGDNAYHSYVQDRETIKNLSDSLKSTPAELPTKVSALSENIKSLTNQIKKARGEMLKSLVSTYAAAAGDKTLITRHDDATPDDLRVLATGIREELKSGIVCIVGLNEEKNKAGLCVTVSKDLVEQGANASEIAADAVKLLGGGTAKNAELALGGGQNVDKIDEAIELLKASCEKFLKN